MRKLWHIVVDVRFGPRGLAIAGLLVGLIVALAALTGVPVQIEGDKLCVSLLSRPHPASVASGPACPERSD